MILSVTCYLELKSPQQNLNLRNLLIVTFSVQFFMLLFVDPFVAEKYLKICNFNFVRKNLIINYIASILTERKKKTSSVAQLNTTNLVFFAFFCNAILVPPLYLFPSQTSHKETDEHRKPQSLEFQTMLLSISTPQSISCFEQWLPLPKIQSNFSMPKKQSSIKLKLQKNFKKQ